MKRQKNNKIKIYQDSKELPFWNYKRIVQTGDFLYMVKGYDPGDYLNGVERDKIEQLFYEVEQDYATSINVKNEAITLTGQYYAAINDRNKFITLLTLLELTIKTTQLCNSMGLPASEELNYDTIYELLKDVKVQKSDDLIKQSCFIQDKIEKFNNQINKLESQLKKLDEDDTKSEYDIEEQFVSVCLGLEIPVDDKNITLYQYGLMVKALVHRGEEMNKMKRNAG